MFLKTVIRLKIVFNIISSLILCELGLIIWNKMENEFSKIRTIIINICPVDVTISNCGEMNIYKLLNFLKIKRVLKKLQMGLGFSSSYC